MAGEVSFATCLTDNQIADHASAAVALRCGYRFSHQAVDEYGPLDWYIKAVAGRSGLPGLL